MSRFKQPALTLLAILLMCGVAGELAHLFLNVGVVTKERRDDYYLAEASAWGLYLAAFAALFYSRLRGKYLVALILVGCLALGVLACLSRPVSSTDSARYNWDGIVQLAGIDPYRYAPIDSHLAPLRPGWLFTSPVNGHCPDYYLRGGESGQANLTCTAINRPGVTTIYPPVAQALFTLARLFVPASVGYLPTQLLGLVAVLAVTALLLWALRKARRNLAWAALWAWSPFVATESVNAGHIDTWAVVFTLAGTLLVLHHHPRWGGVAFGFGIATKFTPLLALPPLLKPRRWSIAFIAAGVTVATYIPHLIALGPDVLGYLPGYLKEEGYGGGGRSILLSQFLPGFWSTLVALALLGLVTLIVYRRAERWDPWVGQVVILGTALLLLSPKYGWYGLILLPLIIMSERLEWLPLIGILVIIQLNEVDGLPEALLMGQLLLVAAVAILRNRHARLQERDRLWKLLPQELPQKSPELPQLGN